MKNVVILGAGGHAHVVADIVSAEGNNVVAFLDDDLSQKDSSGPIGDYKKYSDCEFIIAIGDASVRQRLSKLNVQWHIAVHPSAVVSPSVILQDGTVVMPRAVINARTSVGKHCIVNTGSIVEHDNILEDFVHISVGAKLGGTVRIGKNTMIGIGSIVKNNIKICDDVIIGAGATVVDDINEKGTYVGTPAKKKHD